MNDRAGRVVGRRGGRSTNFLLLDVQGSRLKVSKKRVSVLSSERIFQSLLGSEKARIHSVDCNITTLKSVAIQYVTDS